MVIDETRTTNTTLSLDQRVKMEWKKTYDFFISFHRNAFKPEIGTGAEVYVYKTANVKSKSLAAKIQNALVRVGFRDRGVKEAEYYVLKHTKAPALLLEVGFIDNSADNKLYDAKFEAIVDGIANAVLDVVGVKKNNSCPTCGQKVGI
ncbi:N-acetylmuramoyl-L-alanine amidase [Lysinibacillus sp. NPDC096418]|uniref:N-acetylmuramoyl-L-alanine amidase n=1 Tax=Lysinibacillus sp. NPDC096418 TaxID=3364138 RepID=UPI00380E43E5